MPKIQQAAFRSTEGNVQGTGPLHDIDALPADFVVKDEGFLKENGEFISRQELTDEMHSNHPVQSEELELSKSLKGYRFDEPKLEAGNQYRLNVHDLEGNLVSHVTFGAKANNTPSHPYYGHHEIGEAWTHPDHRGQGLYGRALQLASLFVKHHLKSKGLVSEGDLRSELATGAWQKLLKQKKAKAKGDDFFMSEKNDPDKDDHEFVVKIRQWLKKYKVAKSLNSLGDADHSVAEMQMGALLNQGPEFQAAKFLAGGRTITEEEIREALLLWDHDIEMAALAAYGLPRTEDNRVALRNVLGIQTLNKAEISVAALPRVIKPAVPDAKDKADIIQHAFQTKAVAPVKLGGKHSKGTAIAIDEETNKKYLIKPESGPLSPSSGISEQVASQSQREVAFSKIADAIGLSEYIPEADLLLIDNKEVAVMDLVPTDYKDVNKKRKEANFNLSVVLEPYRKSGELFKWAIIDMILGNPDRNAGNIMVNPDGKVKLIDHGTSFAGFSFNPAQDPKSFIPAYLRAWSNTNFSVLGPEGKLKLMPNADSHVSQSIHAWVNNISVHKLTLIMNEYGILRDAILARLEMLQMVEPEQCIQAVLEFWAGANSDVADNLQR